QAALESSGVPTAVTADQVNNFVHEVSASGLSATAQDVLTQLGVDDTTAERVKSLVIVQDPNALAGDVAQELTNPHLLNTLRTTGASMGPGAPPPGNLAQLAYGFTHGAESYGNFVTAAYQRYLGRTPRAAEVAGWVGLMQQGLSDERLEAGFIGSPEYIA